MGTRSNAFTRTNSICPSSEELLLEYVFRNDIEKIITLLETDESLLEKEYDHPHYMTILYIACREANVEAQTVRCLLQAGANPCQNLTTTSDDRHAIHLAAEETRSDIISVLLEDPLQRNQINCLTNSDNNALLLLIKNGKNDNISEFVKCADILINHGININQADNKNRTAILWAAKKGYREMIQRLLKCPNIDLDSHKWAGKTARELITEKKLVDDTLYHRGINNNQKPEDILFGFIKDLDQDAFINYNNGNIKEYANAESASYTLLQLSCMKGLERVVNHLLTNAADCSKTTKKTPTAPLALAAENGYYKIVDILLKYGQEKQEHLQVPSSILCSLLKSPKAKFPNVDFEECYKKLLSNISNINDGDHFLNTPLHYAIRYAGHDVTHNLLDQGASLMAKNNLGVFPLQDMDPNELEKHLDKCISLDADSSKDEIEVVIDYRTLLPPPDANILCKQNENDVETIDLESGKILQQNYFNETEAIAYMSTATEFKHLLKHPVIVTFLLMKWFRIKWIFFTNLAFYVAFFISLVSYIFTSYGNFSYIEKNPHIANFGDISKVCLVITYFYLVLRELFQMMVAPSKYYLNFENYLEILLIIIISLILFIPKPSDNTRKQLSSLAILLAAFELVLMMGQHPKLSTNVVMLRTVSFNFFKFLLWYSLLIIAFALSFYILFGEPPEQTESKNGEDEEENLFAQPGASIFKTIVMLTGEFDAGSINFHTFPVTSKLIFILFVLMIAITLLNLLNGLAVSDTQMIKNDAELVGHISRTQYIHYVESLALGNVMPKNLLSSVQKICCCLPESLNSYNLFLTPAKSVCIFPNSPNCTLNVSLTRQGLIYSKGVQNRKNDLCCNKCDQIYLDRETSKEINVILQKKKEQEANEECMKKLQNKIDRIEIAFLEKIEHLQRTLDNIERQYLKL